MVLHDESSMGVGAAVSWEHAILLLKSCDYIPVIASITNIVILAQKNIFILRPSDEKYTEFLEKRSTFRCLFLIVSPIFANIAVGINDFCRLCCEYALRDKKRRFEQEKEELLENVEKDGLYLAKPNINPLASQDFIIARAAVKQNIEAFAFVDKELRGNVTFVAEVFNLDERANFEDFYELLCFFSSYIRMIKLMEDCILCRQEVRSVLLNGYYKLLEHAVVLPRTKVRYFIRKRNSFIKYTKFWKGKIVVFFKREQDIIKKSSDTAFSEFFKDEGNYGEIVKNFTLQPGEEKEIKNLWRAGSTALIKIDPKKRRV